MTIGLDEPFEGLPEDGAPILRGLQGGFHVELSVRVRGAFDPDKVQILIELLGPDGRSYGRHVQGDWFLLYEEGVPACDYLKGRVVLVDAEGGLLDQDAAEALASSAARLHVRLESGGVVLDSRTPLTLRWTGVGP